MDYQGSDIVPTCPFCAFFDDDASYVGQHIEFCHPENGECTLTVDMLSAAPQNSRPSHSIPHDGDPQYIDCPHGSGEVLTDINKPDHLDFHIAESVALNDSGFQREFHNPAFHAEECGPSEAGENERGCHPSTKTISSKPTPRGGVQKLGRAELGPYAHEKQMPSWLRRILEKGAKKARSNKIATDGNFYRHESVENEVHDVIQTLSRLCEQDKSVRRAFICSPHVCHVSKMPMEGGFCGYRNIQMMISYIKQTRGPGREYLLGPLPTILQLQDMIERAWDMGFNSVGRIETGGIRGTRKFIGTPEAQALFSSLGIRCEATSIGETKGIRAHDALLANIAAYFRGSHLSNNSKKVCVTDLPPVYFQHEGHSLTIVGFEIRDGGNADILVFDPMFKSSTAMKRLRQTRGKSTDPAQILKGYRRGTAYLQKYKVFETLRLSDHAPSPEY